MKQIKTLIQFIILSLWFTVGSWTLFAQAKASKVRSSQLLVVTAKTMSSSSGHLQRFERGKKGWYKVGHKVRVHLGRNGLGWGRGLHKRKGMAGPSKREGDGKAPAGIFRLGHAFGYKSFRTRYPYKVYNTHYHCVDDVKSKYYNKIIHSKKIKNDYKSHEKMRLPNHYYKYGITVNHNGLLGRGRSKRGAGSCIFLHIKHIPTAGCTVMKLHEIKTIIRWLNRRKRPLLLQGTKSQIKSFWKQIK